SEAIVAASKVDEPNLVGRCRKMIAVRILRCWRADDDVVTHGRPAQKGLDRPITLATPAAEDAVIAAGEDIVLHDDERLLEVIEHQRGATREAGIVIERDVADVVDELPEPAVAA